MTLVKWGFLKERKKKIEEKIISLQRQEVRSSEEHLRSLSNNNTSKLF